MVGARLHLVRIAGRLLLLCGIWRLGVCGHGAVLRLWSGPTSRGADGSGRNTIRSFRPPGCLHMNGLLAHSTGASWPRGKTRFAVALIPKGGSATIRTAEPRSKLALG